MADYDIINNMIHSLAKETQLSEDKFLSDSEYFDHVIENWFFAAKKIKEKFILEGLNQSVISLDKWVYECMTHIGPKKDALNLKVKEEYEK